MPQSYETDVLVLDFLVEQFPHIPKSCWRTRLLENKVFKLNQLLSIDSTCHAGEKIYYYREVEEEKIIPFSERILMQNKEFLIAFKPHFLPTTPTGNYINECLINRLIQKTTCDDLVAVHRLDRDTAGLILCSLNQKTRSKYHALFLEKKIQKNYYALAKLSEAVLSQVKKDPSCLPLVWNVSNRIEPSAPSFIMKITEGLANAHSTIRLIRILGDIGLFDLMPITGKTHQLRIHMQSIGMPILNDRFYPKLQDKFQGEDFNKPLKLLAYSLRFIDPVSHETICIQCDNRQLDDFIKF